MMLLIALCVGQGEVFPLAPPPPFHQPVNNCSPPCSIIPCSETHVTLNFQEREKKWLAGDMYDVCSPLQQQPPPAPRVTYVCDVQRVERNN